MAKLPVYDNSFLSKEFIDLIYKPFSADFSVQSKKNYSSTLAEITSFLKKDFLLISSMDAKSFFEEQVSKMRAGTLKPVTISSKLHRLNAISNFIMENKIISDYTYNPFMSVEIPPIEVNIPPSAIPNVKDMNDILEMAKGDMRLYMALSLIIRCTLTVGELCKLKKSSFLTDAAGYYAIAIPIGKRVRYVKMPKDIVELLDFYIKNTESYGPYLFYNEQGNPMSIRRFEQLYRQYISFPENQRHFTMKDLRNGSAAYMLKCNAPTQMVADYMNITPTWMSRYNDVLQVLEIAAVDYSNISVKIPQI